MMTNFQININKKAMKFMKDIATSSPKDHLRIYNFLNSVLPACENPCTLPNAKRLQGFKNHYRWRVGDFRIVGIVENGEFKIVQIVKISKRDENTYKI